MAERPRELGDFKKARVNGGTAGGSTPILSGRGASRMFRGLMLCDLALLLVTRPKKNVYIFS